jgi:predicted RNase H-like nuclease (RuvC/YqgF family)
MAYISPVKKFDAIVNSFRKTIKDLDDLISHKEIKIKLVHENIANFKAEESFHVEERDKAETLAKKLRQLIGD